MSFYDIWLFCSIFSFFLISIFVKGVVYVFSSRSFNTKCGNGNLY